MVGGRDQWTATLTVLERVFDSKHQTADMAWARQLFTLLLARIGETPSSEVPTSRLAIVRDVLTATLPTMEQLFGPEDPYTLVARADLARWIGEAGDAAGARDQLAALVPVMERVLGSEQPHTLVARNNLADCIGKAGDPGAAQDLLAALVPVMERVLGTEDPDTMAARNKLVRWMRVADRDTDLESS
jgi:hypothetical protein